MADPLHSYEQARDQVVAELETLEPLLPGTFQGLDRAKTRLAQGKFVLAVVGEFSSGKSFLLNALLEKVRYEDIGGTKQLVGLLATDINPSTATITELEYASDTEATAIHENGSQERIPLDALNRFIAVGSGDAGTLHDATKDERGAPTRVVVKTDSPFLQRGFLVADTPGLASINPAHRRATLAFLPNADAVVYLIDTQQPFTEGDAAFLGIIRKYIDSIFIVQTKIDLWQEKQSDGKAAWQHAYDRICALAAVHAPGTHVYALSAREYAEGILTKSASLTEASRFPLFLNALDASLVHRTGRARLRRAKEQAQLAAESAIATLETDRAMLALDEETLRSNRDALLPEFEALEVCIAATIDEITMHRDACTNAIEQDGAAMLGTLEQRLLQAFDTADIARLRDRARLHSLIDRTIADVMGDFAENIASRSLTDLERDAAAAQRNVQLFAALSFSLSDEAARAFGGEPGTHTWSGEPARALAGTIILDAVGGPSVDLVHDIASRFARTGAGQYMKRELLADLRSEIFPNFRTELHAFLATTIRRIATMYSALTSSVHASVQYARERHIGSIDRALQAHTDATLETIRAELAERHAKITGTFERIAHVVDTFIGTEGPASLEETGSPEIRVAHADSSFDVATYQHGLQPQRWRIAVLGALRRGKSSLINAFARDKVLNDDVAGSVRFPIHVRYGDQNLAYTRSHDMWQEISPEQTIAASATAPVLRLTPWQQPRELVLVHAPAFDSGEPHAEDINMVVAAQASVIVCLFSRQLSDRELSLYERVAELGKPMFFVHTLADNENSKERRNVVTLAERYLQARNIPVSRIFTVSAHEYEQAMHEKRAPAGWNELSAVISTIEGQAEAHMNRLTRLRQNEPEKTLQAEEGKSEPLPSKPGFFARLFKVSGK